MPTPFILNFLHLLNALAWPVLIGLLTLSIIIGNQRWPVSFTMALSYCIGMGIVSQLIQIEGCFNVKMDLHSIVIINLFYAIILLPILLWRQKRHSSAPLNFPVLNENSWGWAHQLSFFLLLAYILYQMYYVLWSAYFIPVYQADAFTEYAYKAKIFFYDQGLNQAGYLWRFGYPLQIPLTMDWIALNLGQWNEGWIKIIFACNGLAFMIIIHTFMKYWTGRLVAWGTVALMLTSIFFVLHASTAYGDFTIMIYTMTALLLLCWGISLRRVEIIMVAGIMSAFAASVKLEGINYEILLLIVSLKFLLNKEFFKEQFIFKALLRFFLPLIGILILSRIFQHFHHAAGIEAYSLLKHFHDPGNVSSHFFPTILDRSYYILKEWINNLYFSGNWGFLWFFLTGLWLLEFPIKKSFPFKFLSLAMVLFFLHYAFGSLFAGRFYYLGGKETLNESSRILLHFFPLCPLLIGLLIYDFLKCKKE